MAGANTGTRQVLKGSILDEKLNQRINSETKSKGQRDARQRGISFTQHVQDLIARYDCQANQI